MDFTSILDQFHIEYDQSGRNKNTAGWVNLRCPQCGKFPYLGFNIANRLLFCWSCGKMPLFATLQTLTGLSGTEVGRLVGELPKEDVPLRNQKQRGRLELPLGIVPLMEAHKAYLKNRGFDPDKIEKLWGVQGIGFLGGALSWRIWIPVYNKHNQIETWICRRITNQEPRYHAAKDNQSITSIGDCVYGIQYIRSSCIIVEGSTDCWAIGPGAVALLGLRTSPSQLEALSKIPFRVILFDSGPEERAAHKRSRQLCRELAQYDGVTIEVTLDAKDAASASREEIEEIRRRYLQ